ncbi:MAG: sugar transferase [Longispora sp.]|nr:sugar transferase [Longispora sp. (in: high G+C Gram-positive bacteria)]
MNAARRRYEWIKRLLDITVTAFLLVITSPLMLAVTAAVALALGRPLLFQQGRTGHHGQLFTLVKFRTMRTEGEERGAAGDGERLTRLGKWLRATSLDELPTLWNVLRGDMSLVGPRPLLPSYIDRYTPKQARRHEVRPGITGLAQVRGRNALTWDEKFAYDVQYVDRRCLSLDLRILVETPLAVLRRKGITAKDSPTAPEFVGDTRPPDTVLGASATDKAKEPAA